MADLTHRVPPDRRHGELPTTIPPPSLQGTRIDPIRPAGCLKIRVDLRSRHHSDDMTINTIATAITQVNPDIRFVTILNKDLPIKCINAHDLRQGRVIDNYIAYTANKGAGMRKHSYFFMISTNIKVSEIQATVRDTYSNRFMISEHHWSGDRFHLANIGNSNPDLVYLNELQRGLTNDCGAIIELEIGIDQILNENGDRESIRMVKMYCCKNSSKRINDYFMSGESDTLNQMHLNYLPMVMKLPKFVEKYGEAITLHKHMVKWQMSVDITSSKRGLKPQLEAALTNHFNREKLVIFGLEDIDAGDASRYRVIFRKDYIQEVRAWLKDALEDMAASPHRLETVSPVWEPSADNKTEQYIADLATKVHHYEKLISDSTNGGQRVSKQTKVHKKSRKSAANNDKLVLAAEETVTNPQNSEEPSQLNGTPLETERNETASLNLEVEALKKDKIALQEQIFNMDREQRDRDEEVDALMRALAAAENATHLPVEPTTEPTTEMTVLPNQTAKRRTCNAERGQKKAKLHGTSEATNPNNNTEAKPCSQPDAPSTQVDGAAIKAATDDMLSDSLPSLPELTEDETSYYDRPDADSQTEVGLTTERQLPYENNITNPVDNDPAATVPPPRKLTVSWVDTVPLTRKTTVTPSPKTKPPGRTAKRRRKKRSQAREATNQNNNTEAKPCSQPDAPSTQVDGAAIKAATDEPIVVLKGRDSTTAMMTEDSPVKKSRIDVATIASDTTDEQQPHEEEMDWEDKMKKEMEALTKATLDDSPATTDKPHPNEKEIDWDALFLWYAQQTEAAMEMEDEAALEALNAINKEMERWYL
jgi:hypothetical protein